MDIDQVTFFQIIFLTACGLMGLLGLCGYLGWRLYRTEQRFERMIMHLASDMGAEEEDKPWSICPPNYLIYHEEEDITFCPICNPEQEGDE